MTELLSREEYAAIAATLDLPQRAFIDGGFRDALSLIHISEPTRHSLTSYAVFCLKKKRR
ncbi:hypothetical protein KZ850_26095 [Pseudomonas aeruginosa]|nr:hypothetical protein [Pseudomonas aeruginosa]